MRGKPTMRPIVRGCWRITPADAGKTCRLGGGGAREKDHPRGCGENCAAGMMSRWTAGSPPRMRGKLYIAFFAHYKSRITPADAGKTSHCAKAHRGHEDHPRGCGENCPDIIRGDTGRGSPPRMRGKPSTNAAGQIDVGITPADAGKTAMFPTADSGE